MALPTYERGTSWKSQVVYASGATNVDCSGNVTMLTVYAPDGTIHFGPISGIHDSTGIYHCRPSTNILDDLGIYVEEFKTYFDYGTKEGWRPKYDRRALLIKHVKQ